MSVRVDWFRVLAELRKQGYSLANIAAAIDVPTPTLMNWWLYSSEPSHERGERLIALWIQVFKLPRDALPLNVEDLMSVARAKSTR